VTVPAPYPARSYKNIHDASRTRINAWTLDPPYPRRASASTSELARSTGKANRVLRHDDSMFVPGRVPRRQREQQRQLVEDLHVVLPLVVAWLPPIVGYLPMILAVLAPRQVLSRHFWNPYEIELYAHQESNQRRHFFGRVAELFWNATTNLPREPPLVVLGSDAAGPVIDPRPLFAGVFDTNNKEAAHSENLYASFLRSVDGLPDEYLVPLALASGSLANLGRSRDDYLLPRLLAGWCAPRRVLQYRVRRTARAIAVDDALLIEEGAHVNHCQNLSDLEVMDACLLRGLPLSKDAFEMRQCLSNHVAMVALVHLDASRQVSEQRGGGSKHRYTEAFGLLSLHLSILRASVCKQCAQERALQPPASVLPN
jgi:LETM1-like protein